MSIIEVLLSVIVCSILALAVGGIVYERLVSAKKEGNWVLKYVLAVYAMCMLGIVLVFCGVR